jgi:hypothetical protein
MKKVAFALLLLAGCAGSAGSNNGEGSIDEQIEHAQTKMDSATGLLKAVYDTKLKDSIAYEAYDRDGIGSDHAWTHPDTIKSWIRRDSNLYNHWSRIKDSLVTKKQQAK